MFVDDNSAVAQAWAQATWIQHDPEAGARYLAPDWIGHYAGIGEARGVEGFKHIAGAYLRAFPDLCITVQDALADGDKVVRRVSFSGTHRGSFLGIAPTGRSIQGDGTVILRFAGGKIAEEWVTENLLGVLQQLGAVPSFQLDAAPADHVAAGSSARSTCPDVCV